MFFTALQQEITWKRPGGTTKVKSVNQALEIYFDIKKISSHKMYSVKSDRRYPKEELHDFTAVRFLFKLPLQLERKLYVLSWVISVQTMLDKGFSFFFSWVLSCL